MSGSPRAHLPGTRIAGRAWLFLALTLVVVGCAPREGEPPEPPESPTSPGIEPVTAQWDFEEARQFDFWVGEWDVNLRVQQPDFSWKDELTARAKIYRVLDGKAVVELWDSATIKGFSIRYFDREKGKWVLWLNWPGENRSGGSELEGEFRHGRGEFFGTFKTRDGNDGISRYTFSDIGEDRLRWDDAYSLNGGNTWTNGWIMEFIRTATSGSWPDTTVEAHTYETGQRCDLPDFRTFEELAGQWSGTVELPGADGEWSRVQATMTGHKILDGCAVITFLEYADAGGVHKEFRLGTFNTYGEKFEENVLDNQEGTGLSVYFGDWSGDSVELFSREPGRKTVWDLQGDRTVRMENLESGPDGQWNKIRILELRSSG